MNKTPMFAILTTLVALIGIIPAFATSDTQNLSTQMGVMKISYSMVPNQPQAGQSTDLKFAFMSGDQLIPLVHFGLGIYENGKEVHHEWVSAPSGQADVLYTFVDPPINYEIFVCPDYVSDTTTGPNCVVFAQQQTTVPEFPLTTEFVVVAAIASMFVISAKTKALKF